MNLSTNDLTALAQSQIVQVTLVALLVATVVRLFCRRRPHLAYGLWMLVVVKCLTPPVWSSQAGVFSRAEPRMAQAAMMKWERGFLDRFVRSSLAERPAAKVGVADPVDDLAVATTAPAISVAAVLGVVWIGGVVVLGGVVLRKWLSVWRTVRRAAPVENEAMTAAAALARRLGVRRKVQVRTTDEPLSMATPVQDAIAAVDRNQPVSEVRSMEQVLSAWMARAQFNTLLLSIFAGVALFLAAIGIYGTMSYSVSQRTHELGLRMALGGAQREMLALVVKQGMVLTVIGLSLGLGAAYGLTRLMAGLLFGIGATDTVTFAAVALLLGLIALAACYIPARRATKVDPMVALRYE